MKKFLNLFTFIVLLTLGVLLYRQDISKTVSPKVEKQVAAGVAATPAAPRLAGPDFVLVARVVDGDTVDVLENSREVRVRLLGINTPETVDPRKPVECFGPEASKKMHELLADGEVRLETDPSQDLLDKYGRLLAYVFLPDGTDVNELMITQGFAREYTYKKPYKFQKEFRADQAAAKASGLGLWVACR